MLFWLGAGADGGADGAGAVVLAVVVVVLGVVVVEGLVGLFPPQPAVIAPSATTMTALAITRVWRAVGDGVTFQSSLLPMIDSSAGRSLLGAVLRRPGSSQYALFEGELASPDPGPCSRPAHTRRNLTAPSELRAVSWRRADKLLLPGGDRRRRCRHRVSSRSMI
jgi:hypothetical protein